MTESTTTYHVPARTPPSGWKAFGWQGVTCLIPNAWDVSGIDGTAKQGYFTFDDERSRRFEIKFDRARRWGQPALDTTLENYFKAVRKQVGKKGYFEVDHDTELLDEQTIPSEYRYRTYGWTGDVIGRGIIYHCPVCRRVIIAQCLAEKNRVNLRELSTVLTSIRCHSETDTNLWAVFEFAAEVPTSLDLQQNKLQAGLINLDFYGKNRRLVVERIGLVQAILKHTAIDRYVEKIHYKKLRRRRMRFIEEPWHGHDGFRIDGERSRLMYRIPSLGPQLRNWRRGDHVGGRVWHSVEANRLYVVRAEGKDAQALADATADSVARYGDTQSASEKSS